MQTDKNAKHLASSPQSFIKHFSRF